MNRRQILRGLGAAALVSHSHAKATAEFLSPSEPSSQTSIFLNQIGFLPLAGKQATIRNPDSSQRSFHLRSTADNRTVFTGGITSPTEDATSGDTTSIADFSGFQTPGTYRVEVGGSPSDPFTIAPDVYASALRLSMRAYYGQRCGCAVDLGGGYKHPLCHANGAFHASSGKSGPLPDHGGWHDAGDYGRYIVNSAISTATLLWAWEIYPRPLRSLSLQIPESGGKTPDYLAEVRWNLAWMLTLQDTDGGVWHKQTSEHFCAFIMPQDDRLTSYVIGIGSAPYKSTCATADLAAVMAIAARCYGPYDSAFAQRCLHAARKAWTWAIMNPDVTFTNPPSITTGNYGDRRCTDELTWASAELWRTTGEAQYEKAFLAGLPDTRTLAITEPSWNELLPMACWTYALAERNANSAVKARIRELTAAAAQALVADASRNGYGTTLAVDDYVWGSNGVAGNQSLLLLIADHFQPNAAARQTAYNNLHYLLGRNCHGVSWITQLGRRPFEHPHHRPSGADNIPAPWPGLLSGGPNAHPADSVGNKLPPQPPMRMWVDDQAAYSLNEVAINWNAPLVFLLTAAND
jgi:endoglucanase